jgi:hypothetical protein
VDNICLAITPAVTISSPPSVTALWPRIYEVVGAAHGSICSQCIASALALPSPLVAMATLGLSRRNDFEMANEACASCGVRQRVLRERRIRDTDRSA